MVFCFVQFFLQSNPLKKSLHTMKRSYPVCPASHRGPQCVGRCFHVRLGVEGIAYLRERDVRSLVARAAVSGGDVRAIGSPASTYSRTPCIVGSRAERQGIDANSQKLA